MRVEVEECGGFKDELERCAGGMEGCVEEVCRRGVWEGCGGVHITIPWS